MTTEQFQKLIWDYYHAHGRYDLPWRYEDDPYKVLVSEVMLQQTQVARVLKKYPEFLEKFPTIHTLARATLGDVLGVWGGLGYNRRGKYLRDVARVIVEEHEGMVPDTVDRLEALPGIGSGTAGAICAYAYNKRVVFIETNIRAVFLHHYFSRKQDVKDISLAEIVEKTLDRHNPRDWYYALTDYGVMLKKERKFQNTQSAHYTKQSKFEGSNRQVRGAIIRALRIYGSLSRVKLARIVAVSDQRFDRAYKQLHSEQLVVMNKREIRLSS